MKGKLILPCIRGILGDWVYYSASMNAFEIKKWIEPAKNIKVAKALDEYLQRTLKAREKEIAEYILGNKHHFFNSILVGVYDGLPDWIEFNISSKLKELRGQENSNNNVGLLVFNGNERMFAIDGQHRVKGIIEALSQKRHEGYEQILSDEFPIIFLAHIDDDKGRKRTRRLFSDINKKAKSIPMKDTVIIDEEDIAAIVTRRIYAESKLFSNGDLIDMESDTGNLDKDDVKHFTNITNLYTVVKKLKTLYKRNRKIKEFENENVEKLYSVVKEFLDFISQNISDYNNFFIKKSNSLKYYRENNKYILFRPIGFTLIARIYAYFYKKKELPFLIKNIHRLEFAMPESHLNKILWNNGKMESASKNQNLGYYLSLYLLGESSPRKTTADILKDYRQILKNDDIELPDVLVKNS